MIEVNYNDSTDDQPIVTCDVVAGLCNLSPRRIQQLADEGHIPRPVRDHYPLWASIQGYVKFLQSRVGGKKGSSDEQAERTRLTAAKADLAELERERRVGELMLAEVVRKQDFAIARILRNNLQSIADRVAPMVAAETDAGKVHDLINTEVAQSLESAITAMAAEEVDDATLDITRRTAAEQLAESTASEDDADQ
jgi:phage terminase Nu1 subunit (DNA packaging protein)